MTARVGGWVEVEGWGLGFRLRVGVWFRTRVAGGLKTETN